MTRQQANQIKHRLHQQGTTMKAWAAAHGFKYSDVSAVLRGMRRGSYGACRDIYIAFGLDPDEQQAA